MVSKFKLLQFKSSISIWGLLYNYLRGLFFSFTNLESTIDTTSDLIVKASSAVPCSNLMLILMIWRPRDLNLVMISSLASKWQVLTFGMLVFQPFYVMKLKISMFKMLAFWCQWRYHDQIQITRSLYQNDQIMKC